MDKELRPNSAEKEFLTQAYNRFYDLFEEIFSDNFWNLDAKIRFFKIKEIFGVYSELLNYEPLRWVIQHLKDNRPPMESEIGEELFKVIRNLFTHFPFFEKWDDISFTKRLINWHKENQKIDRFFKKYTGKPEIKYRFWEPKKKKMTYISINFPKNYSEDTKIYLRDMITEKEGIKFCLILMHKVLYTQIEEGISIEDYEIMRRVEF